MLGQSQDGCEAPFYETFLLPRIWFNLSIGGLWDGPIDRATSGQQYKCHPKNQTHDRVPRKRPCAFQPGRTSSTETNTPRSQDQVQTKQPTATTLGRRNGLNWPATVIQDRDPFRHLSTLQLWTHRRPSDSPESVMQDLSKNSHTSSALRDRLHDAQLYGLKVVRP